MPKTKTYDVVIIGAGPAGIFAAYNLSQHSKLSILLLEKGKLLENRKCLLGKTKSGRCLACNPCNQTSGWGGAGAFSDGKLTLTDKVGGWLDEYTDKKTLYKYLKKADDLWVKFGATKNVYKPSIKAKKIKLKAKKHNLELIVFPIRHMGSDKTPYVLQNFFDFLNKKITIKTSSKVARILAAKGKVTGIKMCDGELIKAKKVIIATGREGSHWLSSQIDSLKLSKECNPIDLGVRVETKAKVMQKLTDVLYEAKLIYQSKTFHDRVRTFCMCPEGEVMMERTDSQPPIMTVNGQSKHDKKTDNTNFALLVSTRFTKPFDMPVVYGKSIAYLSNLLGQSVTIQRLGDIVKGRRSTPARIKAGKVKATLKNANPGDLGFVLPYRHMTDILEMLQALDRLCPGIYADDTLLYGVEVKFYSNRLRLNRSFETKIKGLYACGDGAGITRGLLSASVSGLLLTDAILKKFS